MLGVDERAPKAIGDAVDTLVPFDPSRILVDPAGDVVESSEGVETFRHPEYFAVTDPVIGALISEYRTVGALPLTREDYRSRSGLWIDGWECVLGTAHRRREREAREKPRG